MTSQDTEQSQKEGGTHLLENAERDIRLPEDSERARGTHVLKCTEGQIRILKDNERARGTYFLPVESAEETRLRAPKEKKEASE